MSTENEGQNFSALHVVSATPHSLGGNTVPQDKTEHPPVTTRLATGTMFHVDVKHNIC